MILNDEQIGAIKNTIEEVLTNNVGYAINNMDKSIIDLSVVTTVGVLTGVLDDVFRSSGVKDINGVDIREGDNVIKRNEFFTNGIPGIITFERGAFRFNGQTLDKTEKVYIEKGYSTFNNTYEVVPKVIENI